MIDMMSENDPLDNYGMLTEPYGKDTSTYNIKKLFEFCRKIGQEPVELTDEEREQFRTN